MFLRKYGTGTGADVIIPIIKRGVVDFAVTADWTPASGDVKVSKDGAAEANIGTLPVINGTVGWKFVFSDAELQCKSLTVRVVDSATKAVEDQFFIVETYGNASAMFQADLSAANLPVNVTQFGGTNLTATAGIPSVNTTQVSGTAQTAGDIYASQVAIAGYIDTEVSAIKAKTDNLPSDPADQSAVEAAITAATSPLATQASVNTIDDFLDTEIAAIKTKTDQLTFTTANKVDSTAALDPAAILAVADQVWDEAMSGHTTAGTYGGRIVRATNSNTEVQITGSNHIAADVHDFQTGVITAGDFAANSITASALATDAVTEIQSGLASQSSVDTLTSYVDTEVAAIKAKTDNLPSDPADASDIASSFSTVNTKLDTIDDFLDTEIAAIKAKTDNLPADPADQSLVEAAITAATSPLATPAQVNAQVLDVLSVDTFAELAAPPAATSSLKDKITWLFMYARNKVTQTATQRKVYLDDGTTVAGTSATTDNGTTFTKGEDA